MKGRVAGFSEVLFTAVLVWGTGCGSLEQWSSEAFYNAKIDRQLAWEQLSPYERKWLLEGSGSGRMDIEEYYEHLDLAEPFEQSQFGPGAAYYFERRNR